MPHFWAPPCPSTLLGTHLLHTMAQGEAHSHHTPLTLISGVNSSPPAQVPSEQSPAPAVTPLCTCSMQHSSACSKGTPFPATTTQQGQFPPSPLAASPDQLTFLQLPYTSGIHPVLLDAALAGNPTGLQPQHQHHSQGDGEQL